MNLGHDVVLATSDRPSDDILANRAKDRGIEVFRGDLLDVRSRFIEIARDLGDDDVIVRLTGDNTFPDGNLVELAVTALLETGATLVRSMEDSRLPYGLAVEAFRARDLRESLADTSAAALEHVTPPLVRKQNSFASIVFVG
jgi:spore coat polysaccharide biosynthesis protein SpsF